MDDLEEGTFAIWVQKYGLGVEELVPEDFILVDENIIMIKISAIVAWVKKTTASISVIYPIFFHRS